MSDGRILLTGGSGVVGRALLDQADPERFMCLVRNRPVDVPGVETVKGDATLPRFGLSEPDFADLAARTTAVVHAAAGTTFFNTPPETLERDNVLQTERALELADAAGAPIYHVSTAFVPVDGSMPEEKEARGSGVYPAAQAYIRSKVISEQRVAASGLRQLIVRPSVLFGDSQTGWMSAWQGIHVTLRAMLSGEVPAIPVNADKRLDLVPQDVVAKALLGLIEREREGDVLWLTLGERALTVREIADLCVGTAARYGKEVTIPEFVGPELLEQLMQPEALDALPPDMRKRIERQLAALAVAGPSDPMPSSLPELEQEGVLPPVDAHEAFVSGFVYWAERTGIIEPASTA